ncbi:MAG TPA: glycoside hydrolase domain-containing protein [Candidatus Sulfotelmatobacter sp.]|nr:glycoside hydrolase domain-containing protein [Candidatus Sulfotelmatobacter sp.]
MRLVLAICAIAFALTASLDAIHVVPGRSRSGAQESLPARSHLGFDRNEYPGDALLPALRRTFSFTGYWLNNPSGATVNSWTGKRAILVQAGFGFLLLFNGRLDRELKRAGDPAALGATDGQTAAASSGHEGFHPGAVIFLDQEEGGRMLPEQLAYLLAWVDAVSSAGFGAGIYCSGMPAREGHGQAVITANDIREHAGSRPIVYFVFNDACPPAPGCAYSSAAPSPASSGVAFASVWQFAQSPRRREFTKACRVTYNRDGNCYAPGTASASAIDVDLDSATSPDPSSGRQ